MVETKIDKYDQLHRDLAFAFGLLPKQVAFIRSMMIGHKNSKEDLADWLIKKTDRIRVGGTESKKKNISYYQEILVWLSRATPSTLDNLLMKYDPESNNKPSDK